MTDRQTEKQTDNLHVGHLEGLQYRHLYVHAQQIFHLQSSNTYNLLVLKCNNHTQLLLHTTYTE